MQKLLLLFFIVISTSSLLAQFNYYPIEIPMRDGEVLAADYYTIDSTIAKPVILIQTPYNKAPYRLGVLFPGTIAGTGIPFDSSRYNYVFVDWRGRFASIGAVKPGVAIKIGEDGYDAVEWIATQKWCNGKVGTWGPSALGQVQFATAKEKPPHLVCCVPLVKDYKTKYHDYFYGGVLRREHVEALETLNFTSLSTILANYRYNITWQFVENNSDYPEEFEVPMLLISGWYDHFPDGIIRAFHDMKDRSNVTVRNRHKLIFGPWIHGACVGEDQGILKYPNAASTAPDAALRFFDYHLLGAKNGWPLEPVVRYYQLGDNEWRETEDWYKLAKQDRYFYLNSGGVLSETAPLSSSSASFVYNPRNPSPSIGSSRFTPGVNDTPIGPQDQAEVEARDDNLIFSTSVLENDLEVTGAVKVELYFSSDRTDTDIAVRLCDVYPDGRSIIITDAIRRLRFRNSYTTEELMTAHEVYPVTVELQNLAITIKKGHRLRIIITSSDYPRFDLNTNTGLEMYVPGGDTLIATNSIHVGAATASRIVLPGPASTGVHTTADALPKQMHLSVYPNPAYAESLVQVQSSHNSFARLTVYDMMGRQRKQLFDGHLRRGISTFALAELEPGSYIITLRYMSTNGKVHTRTQSLIIK
jgi:uncharacterized protein